MRVATFGGKQIIIPISACRWRSASARAGSTRMVQVPDTWDEVKALAVAFRDKDPDGNGQADTFGPRPAGAKPRDLIHMLDLFVFGSGLRHTLIDPEGKILDRPASPCAGAGRVPQDLFTFKFVAPDTINHSFNEIVPGDRGRPWRHVSASATGTSASGTVPTSSTAIFVSGLAEVRGRPSECRRPSAACAAWPSREFAPTGAGAGIRGLHADEGGAAGSLENVGAGVRKDLDVSKLSPRSQYFAKASTASSLRRPGIDPHLLSELEAAFHRKLLSGIANPPADWKAFITETAKEMRELAAKLKGLTPQGAAAHGAAAPPAASAFVAHQTPDLP